VTVPTASSPSVRPPRRPVTLDRLAVGIFVLLAIEFLLGMILALFVSLPVGAGATSLLASAPVLDLHILVAVLLIGISVRAVALARAEPDRSGLGAAGLALVSSLVATGAGSVFAFQGQHPDASLVMAVGFLGVLTAAFLLRRPDPRGILPAEVDA
jgi:hypothetical protein